MGDRFLPPGDPVGPLPPELSRRLARLLSDGGVCPDPGLLAAGWTDRRGALAPGRALLLGVDVGGTKIHTVLGDLDGRVLAEVQGPTAPGSGDAIVSQIGDQRRAVLAQARIGEGLIAAAGIGLPGSVDPGNGRLHRAPNVVGLEGRDLREALAEHLRLPVEIENDVNLAALGEAGDDGAAGGLVFIALGTGIGMGAVLDNRLVRGATGGAGEIAWLPIGADPFDPVVQPVGALESRVASAAIVRDYQARGGSVQGTLRDLFDDPDDAIFAMVLDDVATLLAQAILAVASVIDPARVVFGGSVGSRPEVVQRVDARLARLLVRPPVCEISRFGSRAGVIGAMRLARTALVARLEAGSATMEGPP